MRLKILFLFLAIPIAFFSCKKDDGPLFDRIEKQSIDGYVEKGPFAIGSRVTVSELDNDFNPTGKNFETRIISDNGAFKLENIGLISKYVQVTVDGYYFDEIRDRLSSSNLSMSCIADISIESKINVNVLTNMEIYRVKHLIREEGKSFSEAKKQARAEVLNIFHITNTIENPERISITDGDENAAVLLAVSVILQNSRFTSEMSELMGRLSLDIEKSGEMTNSVIENDIKFSANNVARLQLERVYSNIVKRYKSFGVEVTVPVLDNYIDFDWNGDATDDEPLLEDKISNDHALFANEEGFILSTRDCFIHLFAINSRYNLFDAIYTKSIDENQLNDVQKRIYNHQIDNPETRKAILDLWSSYYQQIARLNIIIAAAEGKSNAELRFYGHNANILRAFLYLKMTNLWGDIPFPRVYGHFTSPVKTKSAILQQLIADVKQSLPFLPEEETHQESIRFTKWMAYSLLAKLYLENENYTLALEAANVVINSGNYSLEENFANAFVENGNEESIHIIRNNHASDLIAKGERASIVRYAEILLIAAECYLVTNNVAEAKAYINQIKARSKREPVGGDISYSALKKELISEWKSELKWEGFLYPTLKRLGEMSHNPDLIKECD